LIGPEALAKNRIVVDTDVVSYIFNGHTQAQFFRPYLANKTLAVSFMTVAQLYYGAYHAQWGTNRLTRLEYHLKNYVILPYDYDLCLKWAAIRQDSESKGRCIEHSDCWIAACALRHDCALATNNGKHFEHIRGLLLISPSLA
jgi:predicted nucleic acid-binding protein